MVAELRVTREANGSLLGSLVDGLSKAGWCSRPEPLTVLRASRPLSSPGPPRWLYGDIGIYFYISAIFSISWVSSECLPSISFMLCYKFGLESTAPFGPLIIISLAALTCDRSPTYIGYLRLVSLGVPWSRIPRSMLILFCKWETTGSAQESGPLIFSPEETRSSLLGYFLGSRFWLRECEASLPYLSAALFCGLKGRNACL